MPSDQPRVRSGHAERAEQAMLADKPRGDLSVLAERPILSVPARLPSLNRAVEVAGTCPWEQRVAKPGGSERVRIAPADQRQAHLRRRTLGGAITAALPPDHTGVEAFDCVEIPARLVETSAAQRGYAAVERVRRDRQPTLRM